MDETWAGSLLQIFIDDGGFRYTATQRGDGETPPEDRALPAASQQLREPLRDRDAGAAGDGEAADLCTAPALPANQGQALQQASAAAGQRWAVRPERSRQRQHGGERGRGGRAEPEQHPHRGKWCTGSGMIHRLSGACHFKSFVCCTVSPFSPIGILVFIRCKLGIISVAPGGALKRLLHPAPCFTSALLIQRFF